MRQIAIIVTLEGEGRYGGNDLSVGQTLVGHRSYDGSHYDDIITEIEQALARILFRELKDKNPRQWANVQDEDREWK